MSDRKDNPPETVSRSQHLDDDLLIDVVAGIAPAERVEEVLRHTAECSECEARFMDAARNHEMSRANPLPNASAGPVNLVSAADPTTSGNSSRFLRLLVPLALAAALFLVVTTRKPPSATAKVEPYWIPETGDLLDLRGSHESDSDSAFWKGLKAYDDKDVRLAKELLETSRPTGALEDLRRLYLASLLVNSGHPDETLKILKDLDIASLPLPWREDARWMEYEAMAAAGRNQEANDRLDEMARWPGKIGDLARSRKSRAGR